MNLDDFLPPRISPNSQILHAKSNIGPPYNFYGHNILKYYFENVKLKNGLYCDNSDNLIQKTLNEHIAWTSGYIARTPLDRQTEEINKRKELLRDQSNTGNSNRDIRVCKGKYVDLIHPFDAYAFGHLFDTLQKLYPLRELLSDSSIKFLVKEHKQIRGFCDQLSALCDRSITDSDLIVVDKNVEYNIEHLYFGLSPVVPTTFCNETYKWIIDKYYKHFSIEKNLDKNNLKYKLYCDRNHVKSSSRGVLNNEEVKSFLIDQGFIVLTGAENFSDLIRYFADAQIIVGAHGSMLANSLYSKPHTRVYEFCPDNRKDTSFKLKYKMCQNYSQTFVVGDPNYNIILDINLIKHILDK